MHHLKQSLRIFTFLSSARVIVIATFPDLPFSLPSSRTRPPLVLQSSVPVSRLRPSMHNTASGTHCAPIAIPSTRRALLPRNDALPPLRFLLTLSLSHTHTHAERLLTKKTNKKKHVKATGQILQRTSRATTTPVASHTHRQTQFCTDTRARSCSSARSAVLTRRRRFPPTREIFWPIFFSPPLSRPLSASPPDLRRKDSAAFWQRTQRDKTIGEHGRPKGHGKY